VTTKYNAQALMDEVRKEHPRVSGYTLAVSAAQRAIERHEAFRQEVSDAVVEYFGPKHLDVILAGHLLSRFIIPAAKPDPLVEALAMCGSLMDADELRAALEARGFEIREKNDV
jgi:hypothetical protein